jgi:pimeloyl-ACP methyl ester carboxylesterase
MLVASAGRAAPKVIIAGETSLAKAREIEFSFFRLPTTASTPGDPIYYVEGGPGISGIDDAGSTPILKRLREFANVIIVEQRGTGNSLPRLDCNERFELPLDRYPSPEEFIADARRAYASCAAFWRSRGVNLKAYTSPYFADDLIRVADALGHRRIRLVAHSFGTNIAIEAARRHPARISQLLLNGPYPPGIPIWTPLKQDLFVGRNKGNTVVGRLWPKVQWLARKADKQSWFGTSEGHRVRVTGRDVVTWGLYQLEERGRLAALPQNLDKLAAGDETVLNDIASWAVLLRHAPIHQSTGAVHHVAVCATPEHPRYQNARRARKEAWLIGNPVRPMMPEACDGWGVDVASDARLPVMAMPALVIVGTLDWRTPIENADYIMPSLKRGALIICEEGEHGDGLDPNDWLWTAMRAFLLGESLPARQSMVCHRR